MHLRHFHHGGAAQHTAEAQAARQAAEAETARHAAEAETARHAAEAETARQAAEAEAARVAEELANRTKNAEESAGGERTATLPILDWFAARDQALSRAEHDREGVANKPEPPA